MVVELNVLEERIKEREVNVISAEKELESRKKDFTKREKMITRSLSDLSSLRDGLKAMLPTFQKELEDKEVQWSQKSEMFESAASDIVNVNKDLSQKSQITLDALERVNEKEREITGLIADMEQSRVILSEKQDTILANIEDVQLARDDLRSTEREIAEKTAYVTAKDHELSAKEKGIRNVQELYGQMDELQSFYDGWVALLNREKEEVVPQETKRDYLQQFEQRLNGQINMLQESKQAFNKNNNSSSTIEYFENNHTFSNTTNEAERIYAYIHSARDLISKKMIDQAQKQIMQAEELAKTLADVQEKRKITYGIMELKTDVQLAQL